MLEDERKIILKKFESLVKCDINKLKDKLIEKNVFTEKEIANLFKEPYDRHNRRLLIFAIRKKEDPLAFIHLVNSLKEIGEFNLATSLEFKREGALPFNEYRNIEIGEVPKTPITKKGNEPNPLKLAVVPSTTFLDTKEHNKDLAFYRTRSKNRGQVLIINNHKFIKSDHRQGANIDDENLKNLFEQIGCTVFAHTDLSAAEMFQVIEKFAHETNDTADICFVIIMSHGTSVRNETCIYGVDDENYVTINNIHTLFNNTNCKRFLGKPKIFLYQVCRGSEQDLVVKESDGVLKHFPFDEISTTRNLENVRTYEDMLIGYATIEGYQAHRDVYNGTWYIEAFCKVINDYAHEYSFQELMEMVDQKLKQKESHKNSKQTSEFINKGFKQLYLHPGIYMEEKKIKHFYK